MPDTKEWTLIFYLASDNPLAISIVSQLKAIKAAGFHPEANVIVQFDPFVEGVPTHIFDINLINKIQNHGAPNIGFEPDDPFVRDLIDDKLWRDEKTRNNEDVRDVLKRLVSSYNPPIPPNGRSNSAPGARELSPRQSLDNFLRFCCDKYPARHYMVFILGHGVVVGNDVFLFDEHAERHALTLNDIGELLRDFTMQVKAQGSSFELLGFHSCSVSSLEVAYELRDTAKYMLASQGTSFVGSWPYRQMLIRIFNDLVRYGREMTPEQIKQIAIRLAYYIIYNATDFLLAGYSSDICLTNLSLAETLRPSLKRLVETLLAGLDDDLCRHLIILAHWRSQSFFQEMYTDLFDFCFCLIEEKEKLKDSSNELLQHLAAACNEVIHALKQEQKNESRREADQPIDEKLIICSAFAGPESQYSHGMSVYFPWSEPSIDSNVMENYAAYAFSRLDSPSWFDFLEKYFKTTLRESSATERGDGASLKKTEIAELREDRLSLIFAQSRLHTTDGLADKTSPKDPMDKTSPKDPTGGDCDCPSIKNFAKDTRPRKERRQAPAKAAMQLSDYFFFTEF